ncbi:MAG: hypothetical protein ABEK36_04435 [Candidatus Aenigmatarchaeota archaeon]
MGIGFNDTAPKLDQIWKIKTNFWVVSGTGAGSPYFDVSTYGVEKITWEIVSNTGSYREISLQGSSTGSIWYNLDETNSVGSTEMRHVVNKPSKYLRPEVEATSGGNYEITVFGWR